MGKVRTRVLGTEEEKEQKQKAKERSAEKKVAKKKETTKEAASLGPSQPKAVQDDKEEKKEKKVVKKAVQKEKPRGKKYTAAKKNVEKGKVYPVSEAVSLLKKIKYASFDESVEVHINVDAEGLKGEVELPHATGKVVRVAVVSDELLGEIEKGTMNFDILVTHPSYMPKLAKFAKVLGPKGLMPNPKAGTISPNPEELVKKFTKGALRWKTEPKAPLVHQMVGKSSMEDKALIENVTLLLKSVGKTHIMGASVKTTMSPAVKLDINTI